MAPPCCKGLFTTVLAGAGFMMDAYDLFVINTVVLILKETSVATAAVAGSVCGQIAFGMVADRIGRKRGFICTLLLAMTGSLASAFAQDSPAFSIFTMIACFRFVLGVGIGGEYPLSATISSENAHSKHQRGQQVAMVFSMQGVGMLLAPLVGVILLSLLPGKLDVVWRLMVAITGVPGFIMLYWRCKMKETTAFSKAKTRRVSQWVLVKRSWRKLVGTAGCWFLFDITFYANGLFSSVIIEDTGFSLSSDHHESVLSATELNLILVLIAIPGYLGGVLLIDRIGRRKLQMGGFLGMAVTYLIMGAFMKSLEQNIVLFFFVYGLSFFFSNCGPNTTTFVLPSEVFATEIRATCHGLSAAAGKLGAVFGGALLRPLMKSQGLSFVMVFCGLTALVGLAVTYFFVEETLGRSLDEIHHGVKRNEDGERAIALAVIDHNGGEYKRAAGSEDEMDVDDSGGDGGGIDRSMSGTGIKLDVGSIMDSPSPRATGAAVLASAASSFNGSPLASPMLVGNDDDLGEDGHELL